MEGLRPLRFRARGLHYGLSIEIPAQYPFQHQTVSIDDTPVTNTAMERLCGLVAYRLHKLRDLEDKSHSIILNSTEQLRKDVNLSLHSFAEEAS